MVVFTLTTGGDLLMARRANEQGSITHPNNSLPTAARPATRLDKISPNPDTC
jgi:hypothetical protein